MRLTIRTRLMLLAMLPALVALVIGVFFAYQSVELSAARRRVDAAGELTKAAFELSLLFSDYTQGRGERPIAQWQARHASIHETVAIFESVDHAAMADLAGLVVDADRRLGVLIDELTRSVPDDRPADANQRQHLVGQVQHQLHQLVDVSLRLSRASHDALALAEQRYGAVVLAIVVVSALAAFFAARRLTFAVTRSIRRLAEGAERFAAGDLDHRVGELGEDELGTLSASFDRMAATLRETTVSRDTLAVEIAERTRAEQNARRSQELIRRIVDTIPFVVFWKDRDSRYLGCNQRYADLVGRPVEQIAGKDDHEIGHPAERAAAYQQDDRAVIESGEPRLRYEERLHTPGRGETWVETSKVPLADENGQVFGVLGLFQDISARKAAEFEREKLLHDLGERMKEMQCLYGVQRVAREGASIAQILDEAVHLLPPGWHYPDYTVARIVLDGVAKVTEGFRETAWRLASPIVVYGQERGTIEVFYTREMPELDEGPFLDEERKLIDGVAAVLSESIEGWEAHAAIEASEKQFRSYFELGIVGMAITSPEKGWVECNDRLCEILGYDRRTLTGMTWSELTHPEDRAADAEQFERMLAGEIEGYTRDTRFVSGDGGLVWALMAVRALRDEGGKVERCLALLVDITERKRIADELRASNEELEQFAYIASHDLQEPLRKVQAFGDLLRAECGEQLSDDGRQYIGFMQEAAQRMQRLIQDLLQFSRVGTRGQPFSPVNLADIVAGVIDDLEIAIREADGVVTAEHLPTLNADASQMKQLFQNLISNAIKFRRPHQPARVRIRAERHDHVWRVEVADDGIGFDPSYHDRIFVAFQRLHTKEAYAGTGIGLAICRKIVERHRGTIRADSAPGAGTTFYVELPTDLPIASDVHGDVLAQPEGT